MMNTLIRPMLDMEAIEDIKQNMERMQVPVALDGCIDASKGHVVYTLSEQYTKKLIITYNDLRARELYDNYKFYDRQVKLYPAKDLIFFNADVHGSLITSKRLEVIRKLLDESPVTVITTIDGLMDNVLPLYMIRNKMIHLAPGDIVDSDELVRKLVHIGFERMGQVEGPGQFAVRGGILDIYNMSDDCPYRIEFFDDEIDTIRSFDVESQRSIEQADALTIYPASEYVFDAGTMEKGIRRIKEEAARAEAQFIEQGHTEYAGRIRQTVRELEEDLRYAIGSVNIDSYIRYFHSHTVSLLDYFDDAQSAVFLDEPNRIEEKSMAVSAEYRDGMSGRLEKGYVLPGQLDMFFSPDMLWHKLDHMRTVALCTLTQKMKILSVKHHYGVIARTIHTYNSDFEMLVRELSRWKKDKYRILLVCNSKTRAQRLASDLMTYDLSAFFSENTDRELMPGEIMVTSGWLNQGVEYPLIKFAIVADTDIFGEEKKKKKRKRIENGQKVQSFLELNNGDYVVHESYGVGIYRGIEKIEVDHVEKDYIKIEYGGGGTLYVLATQLDAVQKYASGDGKKPKINKLNSQDWSKTKARVRGAVKELAGDLIALYAKRQAEAGYVFSTDTVWQTEFEEMFPYTETDDQLMAIEAVKRDMESRKIMDRLICGDVGYGKTEVAIRAAFKAVQDGKQVVLLVPTTILAQQHFNTFTQRMKDYPVNIEMMSRFRTKAQQAEIVKKTKKGLVDILIGTHRVLSKDVAFKDLGLLIVDEEQRFGVAHKEKIKQLRENVDVLTLTATPIPRTLHMSMIGIRDMSILEEPPQDRMPIQTYVMEFNEEMVREAILRELGRGGQVYYVFNRVHGIMDMANMIQKLVPDAAVAYAHGQMSERELEKIMFGFINGEIDVLVSTTIIETGLDISNVNTMIIHDADKLGLSQLYQLRGRVGRSSRMAYAFLLYKRNTILREVAEKRLSAIREFTELGSGFKIAMRDLEIRGAGNLLGSQQSGHMEAVGYDLYCKMLSEAVGQLKGETRDQPVYETTVEIDVDALIPANYIKNEIQKLEMYKRIAAISCEEDYEEILDELLDRYGEPPKAAQNLLEIALIRALAHEAQMTKVSQKGLETTFVMYQRADVNILKIPDLLEKYKRTLRFVGGAEPKFVYTMKRMPVLEMLKCEKCVIKDVMALIDKP